MGFTNYYNTYVHDYARVVARLQDKLKVPREIGKKGSKAKISWDAQDQECFEEIKKRLCSKLILQRVNPDRPFVLRTDASRFAVGATLEQLVDSDRKPTVEDVLTGKTVPVAFMSRKLTSTQQNWSPREQETYAIILALQKWETWIGLQPVPILSDHKALESWAREVLDTPSGPLGRRSRWHQILSKYDLSVGYIPGKNNTVADILSRWAYPAGQAARDISIHGSAGDDAEMKGIMKKEKEDARGSVYVTLGGPPAQNKPRASRATSKRKAARADPPQVQPPRFEFKKPSVAAKAPVEPRKRFHHTQPQGFRTPSGDQEGTPIPATPPERRAGQGAGGGVPVGVEAEMSPRTPIFVNPGSDADSFPAAQPEPDLSFPMDGEGDWEFIPSAHAPPPDQGSPSHEIEDVPPSEPQEPTPLQEELELEPEQEPERDPPLTVKEMVVCNWEREYDRCPTFGFAWKATHGRAENWPQGFRLQNHRLFAEGKECIPWTLQNATIRNYHDFMLHIGPEKLWEKLDRQFLFADTGKAKEFTWAVGDECETCQACKRAAAKKRPSHFHSHTPPHHGQRCHRRVFRGPH